MKPHGVAGGRLRHVFHIVPLVNVDPYRRDQSPHHVTCHVVNHLAVELCMRVGVGTQPEAAQHWFSAFGK